ncbi:MAG: hypothetical protein JRJ04_08770 [Deltaproteobacteria bacterium]|nr:hypothetical protein [Deltaproteobacteria bacterium]
MKHSVFADTLEELARILPKRIGLWIAEPQDRLYDEKTIYHYIDGAAEVYKAYNMRKCLSRRYKATDGAVITLDIFDMGSSKDAFGVFTHDTEGAVVEVGQDARYRPGWLSFWKHKFFVSIYLDEESADAEKTVMTLGRQVAARIDRKGERPQILRLLPTKGLKTRDIRFLHHPVVLNYHYYLADENILNVTPQTDVVLAAYQWGKHNALLLMVKYPNLKTSQKSFKSFLKYYLPDADDSHTTKLEDGTWASAMINRELVVIVLEADSKQTALRLLNTFKKPHFK